VTPRRRRGLTAAAGVLYVGVAVVAASVSAWSGMVAGLLLAAVLFVIAARLPVDTAS
jgi:tetrahydromethanopterin S-methyltransferase subunit F